MCCGYEQFLGHLFRSFVTAARDIAVCCGMYADYVRGQAMKVTTAEDIMVCCGIQPLADVVIDHMVATAEDITVCCRHSFTPQTVSVAVGHNG